MVVEIDKNNKLAYIWLTNKEQQDIDITNDVSLLIKNFSSHKYKTVIFKSGKENLLALTENLFRNNLSSKSYS